MSFAPGFVFIEGLVQVKLLLPQRRNANRNKGGGGGGCVGCENERDWGL